MGDSLTVTAEARDGRRRGTPWDADGVTRRPRLLACGVIAAALLAGCGGSLSAHQSSALSGQVRHALAYSHCMRSHGLSDFPDPNGQGNFRIHSEPGTDLDPNASAFQAALKACGPIPSSVTPAQENQAFQKDLKAAGCMRANGVPDYPEPQLVEGTSASGSILLHYNPSIDPNAPAVQEAARKCGYRNAQQLLEFGAGG
jgi:hypothetical protein